MVDLALIFLTVSTTFSLPPSLLSSVCYVESRHKVRAINRDDNGSPSLGVCQVKEKTARIMGYRGTAKRLWQDPNVNIYYAGKYLKFQMNRYYCDIYKSVAAYNAGSYREAATGVSINHKYVNRVFVAWTEAK